MRSPGHSVAETACIRAPPPEVIPGIPDGKCCSLAESQSMGECQKLRNVILLSCLALKITVIHAECPDKGIPMQLHSENIIFPLGASVVEDVVQVC